MMQAEKMKRGKQIISKAYTDVCEKFKCEKEDIRDCTVRNILARTYFIKQCFEQGIPIKTLAYMLGDRTKENIQDYLDGKIMG